MRLHMPGLTRHKTAQGYKYRVRAKGDKNRRVTLPCGPDHPEFQRCYAEARRGVTPKIETPAGPPRGSLEWLLRKYEAHMDGAGLHPQTIQQRRAFFAAIIAQHGGKTMDMPRSAVIAMRDKRQATPGAADNLVKALRAAYSWAVDRGLVARNPALDVSKINRGKGAVPWTVEDLAQFRDRHPIGTMPHLALSLFTFTGARLGDVCRMGRHMEAKRGGVTYLAWEPEKRGSARVSIPILPPLVEAIRAQPIIGPTYLLTAAGKPFASKNAFGNWFRERAREAGLEGRSPHGIRKAAGELLALHGATQYHIMAVLGHTQAKTSEVYTAGANRDRLAEEAMQIMGRVKW